MNNSLPFDMAQGSKNVDLAGNQDVNKAKKKNKKEEVNASTSPVLPYSSHTQSRLAGHIRQVWEKHRRSRLNIEDKLLFCLRSRRGEYSQSELQNILNNGGADPVFIKLTGTKCRAASSWIRDIVLPAGTRPWSLNSTTEPELPAGINANVEKSAIMELAAMVQEGIMDPKPADVYAFLERTKKFAKDKVKSDAELAAAAMSDRISDCMDEGNWDNAVEEFIEDFVTYPTAFFKGPYYRTVSELSWGPGFSPVIAKKTKMYWTRISPFDMYPAPHARNLRDGDLIERLRLTREKLFSFIGLDGYSEEEIRHCLDEFNRGTIKDWIWEEFERERLESDTTYFTSEPDTIDAIHYWGSVKGEWLAEWGIEIDGVDDQKPYEIDAILIGNRVIRAVINDDPLGMRPYHHACWDAVPSSIWGISLPEQMEDHQKIINACARALCNNMAIASGPQAVVQVDRLAENEDPTGMFPFKIWQMKSSMTGASGSPVEFFQPNMNSTELLGVLTTFEQKADDVTNVPRYSYGNEKIGGAGSTASGLSMLMNSAAKGIRRAISSIDANVIRPSVYQSFVYLMLNDPDPSIKGDCKVVPRGATALLIKDQTQVRVQSFLQLTANPIDMSVIGLIGRARLLKEAAKLMDLPDNIVPDPDDLDFQQKMQKMEAQQQAQQQAQQALDAPPSSPGGPSGPGGQGGPGMTPGIGNESQMQQNSMPSTNQANPSSVG